MKINFNKIFIDNFWAKFLCLAISGVLWLYVSSSQSIVDKFPGTIKIKAINTPTKLAAIYDTKDLEIKIGANRDVWQKISPDSFTAYVDLNNLSEGTHEVIVNITSNVQGVQIIDRKPEKILVRVEPVISKDFELSTVIEGNAAEGMVAGDVKLSPNKVKITGSKSELNEIKTVSATIKLNGEKEDFEKNIIPTILNDRNEPIANLELSPKEILAKISIIKGSNTKTVPIKPKIIGMPKDGYIIDSISVNPNLVDITASTKNIADIKYIETDSIDIRDQSNNLEKEVNLIVPPGISVIGNSNLIKVKVTLSPILASRTISVSNFQVINFFGQVDSFDPNELRLTLSGQLSLINKLSSSDISITVDLRGKTSQNNIIETTISQSDIKLPEGISLQDYSSQTMRIKTK